MYVIVMKYYGKQQKARFNSQWLAVAVQLVFVVEPSIVRRPSRQMSLPFPFSFSFRRRRRVSRRFSAVVGARAAVLCRRRVNFRCRLAPEVGRRRRRDVISASAGTRIGRGVAKKSDAAARQVPAGQRERGRSRTA